MRRRVLGLSLLAALLTGAAVLAAACGGSGSSEPTPTGVQITTFDNADTLPKTRDAGPREGEMTLAASDPADFGAFSRFSYYFIELVPSYDVHYVDQPTDCDTSEPVAVGGQAFLQVTFTPARDHNNEGNKTHFPSPDDPDVMPAVEDIVQTCDSNGQLTFVFGLVQPDLKFRVNTLTLIGTRETIAVDIENP